MLLKDGLSQLRRAEILLSCRFGWIFNWSELVHMGNILIHHGVVQIGALGPSFNSDLDLSFQFHIGLHLSVDGKVAQTQDFPLVF
jgi:hypothetical protein